MKKILFLILAVMMLTVGITGTVSADYIRGSAGEKLETHTITVGTSEAVSLSTIPTGARILGFIVGGYGGAGFVALYDDSSMGSTNATFVFAEAGAASGATETVWFPIPYKIEQQLYVYAATSTTSVTVYYE